MGYPQSGLSGSRECRTTFFSHKTVVASPAMNLVNHGAERRKYLWDSMLDAEMNFYYWDLVSARYASLDLGFKVVIAIAASGTVAGWGLWSQYPGAWKLFSGIACVSSLVHPYICSAERLKRTAKLVGIWKEVFVDYELLWYKSGDLESPEAWKMFGTIKRREGKIDQTHLPKWKSMIEIAYQRVVDRRKLTNG